MTVLKILTAACH